MRIVIDLQGCQTGSRFRGIGRYSLSFTKAFIPLAEEHEIWIVLNAAIFGSTATVRDELRGLIPESRIRIFDVPNVLVDDMNEFSVIRSLEKMREIFIEKMDPDLILVTSLFENDFENAVSNVNSSQLGTKTAVVLYDLIPLQNPGDYLQIPIVKKLYERKIEALKKADILLAISDYSRIEAVEALDIDPEKVINISSGIDPRFKPTPIKFVDTIILRLRYAITREMILCAPGGFDPRKNVEGLIKAYSLLPQQVRDLHQLVIVSKINDEIRSRLKNIAASFGLASNELVLTGYVSDQDLIPLYTQAALCVFPSKHEGFGLPALEAMACGAPVIGSNTASIPEVIGFTEALFDPSNPKAIASKILQALEDQPFRQALRANGLIKAQNFSWTRTAARALAAIENLKINTRIVQDNANSRLSAFCDTIHVPENEIELVRLADCIAYNTGRERPQFFIDVTELAIDDKKSGIQRVVRSLLLEIMEKKDFDYDISPVYFDGCRFRYAQKFAAKFMGSKDPIPAQDTIVDFCQDDVYLALDLNMYMSEEAHDHYLRMQNLGIMIYFIVYDMLLLQRPDWWREGDASVYSNWIKRISETATGLICISNTVADELRTWLKEHPPARTVNPIIGSFHLGADIERSSPTLGIPGDALQVLATVAARPSFLMVGTLEPRKAHAQALAAFEILWSLGHDVNLVIVGKFGWLVEDVVQKIFEHAELNQRLIILNDVSDEYLTKIYEASTCLLAASEGEGFGLPLIEAAKHRKYIIARDISVFREVAGEHAYYFTGSQPRQLADAIACWIELNATNAAPATTNMKWLTWNLSAQQLLRQIFQ